MADAPGYPTDAPSAVMVLPDGRIEIAEAVYEPGRGDMLARFTSSGGLDGTLSGNGFEIDRGLQDGGLPQHAPQGLGGRPIQHR